MAFADRVTRAALRGAASPAASAGPSAGPGAGASPGALAGASAGASRVPPAGGGTRLSPGIPALKSARCTGRSNVPAASSRATSGIGEGRAERGREVFAQRRGGGVLAGLLQGLADE